MASTPEQKHARYLRHRDEVLAAQREWRRLNPAVARARAHSWYARNRVHRLEVGAAWRRANRARMNARQNERNRLNRAHRRELERASRARRGDEVRQLVARRRALRANAPGSHTLAEWREKVALFGGCCAYCGRADVVLARDHVVPLSRGGTDNIANVVPACGSCNSRKGTRTAAEYLAALEELRREDLERMAKGSGGESLVAPG